MTRAPDFGGVAQAWKMEMGEDHRKEQEATIAGYVIRGPYHPFWKWWMISVVHLRPLDGVPPAKKHYPEAEYEFMIMSIDPEKPEPDPDKPFPQDVGYLTPADCVVQFDGVTDEQAAEVCEAAAKTIANGMSCDSDFRSWWEGSIRSTVQHYKEGKH